MFGDWKESFLPATPSSSRALADLGTDHVGVHDGLLCGEREVLGARFRDFLGEVLDVGELVPEVELAGGVLVLHRGSDFDFADGVGVGDDAVVDGAGVGEVAGDGLAEFLALDFVLAEVRLGALDVGHVVIDHGGDELDFLVVGECHKFTLRAVWRSCRGCSVDFARPVTCIQNRETPRVKVHGRPSVGGNYVALSAARASTPLRLPSTSEKGRGVSAARGCSSAGRRRR